MHSSCYSHLGIHALQAEKPSDWIRVAESRQNSVLWWQVVEFSLFLIFTFNDVIVLIKSVTRSVKNAAFLVWSNC